LIDGGAGQFAKTIEAIRSINNNIKIEALIPDFSGNIQGLETVISAHPSILAHNIETVKRLYPTLRPKADYKVSLEILSQTRKLKPSIITKSSLMLGLGESEEEVIKTLQDLRSSHCDILTLGQYLAPSQRHYPVQEFISIEQFKKYAEISRGLGFKAVLSGPKVRSSYQAEETYQKLYYA
jgi:lipoic acid synthetase